MIVGSFSVYDNTLRAMANSTLVDLSAGPITAVLLGEGYAPDFAAHQTFSDISSFEVVGGDYARQQVNNPALTNVAGGYQFTSSDILFGNPVNISGVKYLVFVAGSPGAISTTSLLIGFQDLNLGGGEIESINSEFTVQTPVGGWFQMSRV